MTLLTVFLSQKYSRDGLDSKADGEMLSQLILGRCPPDHKLATRVPVLADVQWPTDQDVAYSARSRADRDLPGHANDSFLRTLYCCCYLDRVASHRAYMASAFTLNSISLLTSA